MKIWLVLQLGNTNEISQEYPFSLYIWAYYKKSDNAKVHGGRAYFIVPVDGCVYWNKCFGN